MIDHDVPLIILPCHFYSTIFVGVMNLNIFNIAILSERNFSEVVDRIITIYDTMIGHDE
jgi:hypothetical protein